MSIGGGACCRKGAEFAAQWAGLIAIRGGAEPIAPGAGLAAGGGAYSYTLGDWSFPGWAEPLGWGLLLLWRKGRRLEPPVAPQVWGQPRGDTGQTRGWAQSGRGDTTVGPRPASMHSEVALVALWGQDPQFSGHAGDGEGAQVALVALWGEDPHPLRHSVVTERMWGGHGGTLGTGAPSLKAQCGDGGAVGWFWWQFGVRGTISQGTAR